MVLLQNKKQLPFQIFSLALMVVIVLPGLFRAGMFMDGQQYACVAKNLAEGNGSFWFPYLNASWWKAGSNAFMEHPPLAYALQSGFFKAFGDSMYTERLYSLFTFMFSAYLIARIWINSYSRDNIAARMWYLPLVLWVSVPLTSWSFQNNMLENTMMVFDLAAVLFLMKSLHQKNLLKLAYLGLSAVFTIAAFLSKGLPGLFPLVVFPVFGWYFKEPFKHAVFSYGLFLSFVMLFSYLVLLLPGAKESLSFYFNYRLLMRISNEPTVASHLHLLGDLIMNLLPIIIFLLILFVYEVRKKSIELSLANDIKHKSLCFLVIAFLASFPLLVTPVQRGFYLHTSFPFYALAGAVWLVPFIKKILLKSWFGRLNNWMISVSMIFLLFAVMITFASAGKPGKHPVLLEDVHAIGECMKDDKLLSVPAETYYNNWSLQMYLTRFYDITIKVDAPQPEYQLIPGKFAGSNYCYEMKSSDLVLTKKSHED